MAPALDIKLEVVLNDTSLKYYPGDQVEGKIFITSNQNHRLTNLRLAWTGRISVQPIQANKDFRIYFDECWKLGPMISKSPAKTNKGSSQVAFYHTHLIPVTEDSKEPKVDLPKNKTVGFTFKVTVPNDRPLPSSTERTVLNSIIYLLEAFIDQEAKPVFFGQRVVPVYEAIYTRTVSMTQPQRAEQVFMVSLLELKKEFTSAMRVTLPCRGCQSGIAIPVSITIWNNMEFSRRQGISISLLRVNHIIANGRTYTSPGEKIHRVVTDLNITSDDSNNQKVQTVRIGLPIPKGTIPTITIDKSQLLSVSYFIRVQVFAQEGIYTTAEGVKSQFMMVDIPFIIGTLATSSPTSPMATPISSPKSTMSSSLLRNPSTNSSIKTPISSPRLSTAGSLLTSAFSTSYVTPKASTSTKTTTSATGSITPIASPELDKSTIMIESKKSRMSGMFRKTSSGSTISTISSIEERKKKNVFSTLRLYGRNKDKDVSPAVIMTRTEQQEKAEETIETKNQAIVETTNQDAGVFNIFGDDELSDCEPTATVKEEPTVFKMFDDSDSEDETANNNNGGVFNMFPDSDDESDDEIQILGGDLHGDALKTIATNNNNNNTSGSKSKLPTHVFKMFDDSDSDDEDEEEINNLSVISSQDMTCVDERVKPSYQQQEQNARIIYHKPDDIKSSSEDDDESDLLATIAKTEKLRI